MSDGVLEELVCLFTEAWPLRQEYLNIDKRIYREPDLKDVDGLNS